MAKIILYRDFLDYTISAQSSEQASSAPASNVKLPEKQFRYWRTTGVGDSWITIDLGAAVALTSVALINVNFVSYKIQGHTSTDFTTPSVDSGLLSIVKDTARGRYYAHTTPQDYAPAFNYRYLRLFIPAQTPVDLASSFKVGGLVVQSGTTTLTHNPDVGLELIVFRYADRIESRTGIQEVRNVSERLVQMSFSTQRDLRIEAEFDEFAERLLTIDEDENVLFFDNGNFLSKTTNSPFVYVMKRVGAPTLGLPRYPMGELNNVVLVEQA